MYLCPWSSNTNYCKQLLNQLFPTQKGRDKCILATKQAKNQHPTKKKEKKRLTRSEIRRQNRKWFCSMMNAFGKVSMEESIKVTRFGAGCVEVCGEVCSGMC